MPIRSRIAVSMPVSSRTSLMAAWTGLSAWRILPPGRPQRRWPPFCWHSSTRPASSVMTAPTAKVNGFMDESLEPGGLRDDDPEGGGSGEGERGADAEQEPAAVADDGIEQGVGRIHRGGERELDHEHAGRGAEDRGGWEVQPAIQGSGWGAVQAGDEQGGGSRDGGDG